MPLSNNKAWRTDSAVGGAGYSVRSQNKENLMSNLNSIVENYNDINLGDQDSSKEGKSLTSTPQTVTRSSSSETDVSASTASSLSSSSATATAATTASVTTTRSFNPENIVIVGDTYDAQPQQSYRSSPDKTNSGITAYYDVDPCYDVDHDDMIHENEIVCAAKSIESTTEGVTEVSTEGTTEGLKTVDLIDTPAPASPEEVLGATSVIIGDHNIDVEQGPTPQKSPSKFRSWVVGTPNTVTSYDSGIAVEDAIAGYLKPVKITSVIDYYDDENVSVTGQKNSTNPFVRFLERTKDRKKKIRSFLEKRNGLGGEDDSKAGTIKLILSCFFLVFMLLGVSLVIISAYQYFETAPLQAHSGSGNYSRASTYKISDLPPPVIVTDPTGMTIITENDNSISEDDEEELLTALYDSRIQKIGQCCKNGSDRLHNNEKLTTGCLVCSKGKRFAFGITNDGDLVHYSVEFEKRLYTFYEHGNKDETKSIEDKNNVDHYFQLLVDGRWVIKRESLTKSSADHNTEDLIMYNQLPNKRHNGDIALNTHCLDKYDCPYLHLHQNGVLVLNWISSKDGPETNNDNSDPWKSINVQRVYDFNSTKTGI